VKLCGPTSKNQNGRLKESRFFENSKLTLKIPCPFQGPARSIKSTVSH